ncbi:MAG: hypothetical protein P8123_09280, partial [bacterium]
FMLDIVEHLYEHELKKVLLEVRRVLKPDGRVIVHTSPNKFLMYPVRVCARLLRASLRSDRYHVNEQSIFSLSKVLGEHFAVERLLIEKDIHYWVNSTPERGAMIRTIARIVDRCVDAPLCDYVIKNTILRCFFGTDIWAVAKPIP